MQAADFGAAVPLDLLHETALAAIRARPATEPVAIACSGGADSVALLLLLWTHLPERRGRWLVLHFDHRLRGRASTADAKFVRALAQRLGERCQVETWQRKAAAKETKVSEAVARAARWAFFEQAMRDSGACVIALGHQLNDVAETMLMRLTRGSGAGGLAAPRPVQRMADKTIRVRPLLSMPAEFLRSELKRIGASWREDATNATDDFFRNRMRRHVLPELIASAGRGRNALVGFADARAQLEEDDAALETWLGERIAAPASEGPYDLSALQGKPVALLRRAIHRWALAVGLSPSPTKSAVDWLMRAFGEGRDQRLSAGVGRFIILRDRCLSLSIAGEESLRGEPWLSAQLDVGCRLIGPRGDRLLLRKVRLTRTLYVRIRAGDFPHAETVFLAPGAEWRGSFGVRAWQPGDRYRPLGASGRAKLQDLFVNHRIPQEQRSLLPVVEGRSGGAPGVLWVPGLPPAQEVAIQPASKLVVQLTYTTAPTMVRSPTAHTFQDV